MNYTVEMTDNNGTSVKGVDDIVERDGGMVFLDDNNKVLLIVSMAKLVCIILSKDQRVK